jgi:hypothetical protein
MLRAVADANVLVSAAIARSPIASEMLTAMIASAVALLFAADAARNVDLLRGAFADPVIAQCERNAGCLRGAEPSAVQIELVGAPLVDDHPLLRVHLSIDIREGDGEEGVMRQFWDLQPGAQATVGKPMCPNCGAPITTGALICGHCGTDVRGMVCVPLLVSRMEIY